MTDHLDQAHEYILRALYPIDTLSGLMDLAAAVSRIFDYLEAQQTSQQPATAPPASQQGDRGHRDGDEAARPKLNAQTAPSIPTDLTASQGETGHEDQYETDFDRWLSGIGPGQREQITRDIEAARDLIDRERHPEHMTYTPTTEDMQTAAGLAGWSTDEWREWYYTMRAEVRAQALAPIREALSGHPGCDFYPDGDPITCGWKRAVASVQAALDKEDR